MIETLNARLNIANKERYGTSKSQKGIKSKPQPKGKNDDRDDFDGTNSAAQEEQSSRTERKIMRTVLLRMNRRKPNGLTDKEKDTTSRLWEHL